MSLPPFAAMEIGTHEVRVVVAEMREDMQLNIIGTGIAPSRGVRKGEIVEPDHVRNSVKAAIDEAEANSSVSINSVLLVFSGGQIQQIINRGTIPVATEDRIVTRDHIEDVMANARAVNVPPERDLLHTICQHYCVDSQVGVINPEGMVGSRLAVDMLVLHVLRNRMLTMVRVIEECEVDVEDVAFGGLCSGLAVLTPQQKEGGAIVIDLGAGTTDFVVYAHKSIACAGSIAVGGDHCTNDLKVGLNLPTDQAEKLKQRHGSAMIDLGARDRRIRLPAESGFPGCDVPLRDANTILHARMKETFELVRSRVPSEVLRQSFSAGVILTGGGARVDRVEELGSKVFEMPCHLGRPKGFSGLAIAGESPEMASCVGMLKYGMRSVMSDARGGKGFGGLLKSFFGR